MLEMLEILRTECISRYVTLERMVIRRVIVAFELAVRCEKIVIKRAGNEKLHESSKFFEKQNGI